MTATTVISVGSRNPSFASYSGNRDELDPREIRFSLKLGVSKVINYNFRQNNVFIVYLED